MTTLLDSTLAEVSKLRAAKTDSYVALARRAAVDEPLDAQEVANAINAAGKAPTDFRALVGKLSERERMRASLKQLPAIDAELAECRVAIDAANAELENAAARHREKTYPLQHRIAELNQEMLQLGNIPTRLRESSDPTLLEASREIGRQRTRCHEATVEAATKLRRLRAESQSPEGRDHAAHYAEAITKAEAELTELEQQGADLARRADELDRQILDY